MLNKRKNKDSNDVTIWDAVKEGWQNIDAHAFPGTLIFLSLIGIEACVNIVASIPKFGLVISIGVGLLFGVFLGMWHIISERPHNSVKQQSIVDFLVTFISALAIILIVANLLRLDLIPETITLFPVTTENLNGWDVLAIILMGTAFAFHLFGYLQWHKADNRRKSMQNYNRKLAIVQDAEKDAELAGKRAEVRLMALEAALSKETELRSRFAGLPSDQLERIIKEAKDEIYAAFEKTYNMDIDNSGKIGDKPAPHQSTTNPNPVASPTLSTPVVHAKTVPIPEVIERDNNNRHPS